MNLQHEKMIADLRVYQVKNVSREKGRKTLKELESSGQIAPLRTPTGRCLLSILDAERLAGAL